MPELTRSLASVGLAALVLAGCLPGGLGEECERDEDCNEAEGLGCWENYCRRFVAPDGPLLFEVIPGRPGLAPATAASSGDSVRLVACPPAPLEVDARDLFDEQGPDVEALEVRGAGRTELPGTVRRFSGTIAESHGTLALPPGRWDLRFSAPGIPPVERRDVVVPACGTGPTLELAPAEHVTRVALALGPGPRCGARFTVIDGETGEVLSAPLAITAGADQGCPAGELQVRSDQDDPREVILQVRPADGARPAVASQDLRFRIHPRVEHGFCAPDAEPPCPGPLRIDLAPPEGDLPAHLGLAVVEARDASGAAIAPARLEEVRLRGTLSGHPDACGPPPLACGWGQEPDAPAWFETVVRAPASGRFEVPVLVPGTYEVTVVPRAGSGLARAFVPGVAMTSGGTVRVTLPAPVALAGQVSASGEGIAADLEALPLEAGGRSFAATSDRTTGAFTLAVDPGRYRLRVRPRNHVDRAPVPGTTVELPEVAADAAPPPRLEVKLPAPARVTGTVVDGVGAAVAGAAVRAFRCLPDCEAEDAATVPAGAALTAADGSFEMIVPGR